MTTKLSLFYTIGRVSLYRHSVNYVFKKRGLLSAGVFLILPLEDTEVWNPADGLTCQEAGFARWSFDLKKKKTIRPGFKLCAYGRTTVVQTNQRAMRACWQPHAGFRCDDSERSDCLFEKNKKTMVAPWEVSIDVASISYIRTGEKYSLKEAQRMAMNLFPNYFLKVPAYFQTVCEGGFSYCSV